MLEAAVSANDEGARQVIADVREAGVTDDPFDALRLLAEAFVRRRDAGRLPSSWRRPGFIREVWTVRAHLAPISTQVLLASSFGREASWRDERAPTLDRAAARIATSPVHVAYAIRWLELASAEPSGSRPSATEQDMTQGTTREGERARRSLRIVRLGDSRRRRLATSAVIASHQPRPAHLESPATSDAPAEADELIWFG